MIAAVLMLTHDHALWNTWQGLAAHQWLPARGQSLADLDRWRSQGRELVVLDMGVPGLPDWSDAAWAEHLRDLKVIAATMAPDDTEGTHVISAGAAGYVHAYSPMPALDTVLKTVQGGSVWMGPTLLARLLRDLDQRLPQADPDDWAANLTAREKAVAQRAAIGHSNQAIADALGITKRTVRAHLSAVFEKLDVSDRLMLALKVHGIQVEA